MESFKANFMEYLRSNSDYYTLKKKCELMDSFNEGLLSKVDFCNIIHKTVPKQGYRDEDIMKFIRISSLYKDEKVMYPEFLDIIFYDCRVDNLNEIINTLNAELKKCNSDYKKLFSLINANNNSTSSFIEINVLFEFLKSKMQRVNKNTICKLDLDQDGKISVDDLKNTMERNNKTAFFKYENNGKKI